MSKIIHLTELMSTLYSSNRPNDQFSWLSRSSTSLISSKSSSSQALGEELPSLDTRGATELIVLLLCCFWGLGLGTSSLGGDSQMTSSYKTSNGQSRLLINADKVQGGSDINCGCGRHKCCSLIVECRFEVGDGVQAPLLDVVPAAADSVLLPSHLQEVRPFWNCCPN